MRRFILNTLALGVMVQAVGGVQAGPANGGRRESNEARKEDGRRDRGYKGWSSRYFDERFGCFLYRDEGKGGYYYWCQRDNCYYPTEYCPYNTYNFGSGCVFSDCPVREPMHNHYPSPKKGILPVGPGTVHIPPPPTTGSGVTSGIYHIYHGPGGVPPTTGVFGGVYHEAGTTPPTTGVFGGVYHEAGTTTGKLQPVNLTSGLPTTNEAHQTFKSNAAREHNGGGSHHK
jgi:hypothetical protein